MHVTGVLVYIMHNFEMGGTRKLFLLHLYSLFMQDDFPGGAEEWYHYIRNFTVNNMVVEIF